MRTKTALDTALLTSPYGSQSVYLKVEVDSDGAGTYVDLSDWNGIDFVRSVSYSESIGTPAWTAVVTLSQWAVDDPRVSLSPYMTSSLLNLSSTMLQPYRAIKISTAVTSIDAPRPSSFNLVFKGRIDSIKMSGGVVELSCRDQTADLMDRLVEAMQQYGDDTPASPTNANLLEDIIQNILDDHYNTAADIGGTASSPQTSAISSRTTDGSPYQLYSPNGTSTTPYNASDVTTFSLRSFALTKSPVWEWVSRLAGMIGYSLRFRYHEGTGIDDIVLVLEEPDRSSPSSSVTLNPLDGQCRIESVGYSMVDVRNVWEVGYALNGGEAQNYTASDATSITKFGRRVAGVQVGSASQIDTATEAQAMADALLADTKDPTAEVSLVHPYLWYLQLNDIVTLTADNIYFAANQSLACIARSNSIVQGGPALTRLVLRGALQQATRRPPQRQYDKDRPSPDTTTASSSTGLMGNGDFGDRGSE